MPRLSATAWVAGALAAALIALLIFGLAANNDDTSIDDAVQNGERPAAPGAGIERPVLGEQGEQTSLRDYRGQIVVLNFWASWCKPCTAEAPDLQRAHEQLQRAKAGTVLGATYDDSSSASLKFHREQGLTYPSLRDVGTELAQQFGTRALPETFVLDAEGRIVSVSRGQLDRAFLDKAIAQAKTNG